MKKKTDTEIKRENRYLRERVKSLQNQAHYWGNRYTSMFHAALQISEDERSWRSCAKALAWSGTGNKKLRREEQWKEACARLTKLKAKVDEN